MQVKSKQTGRILTVPDTFYQNNPGLYEPIQQQQQVASVAPQKDIISQGGDLIKSILSPFTETAKRIGGNAFEQARASGLGFLEAGSDKMVQEQQAINEQLKKETDPNKKKMLLERSRQLGDALLNANQPINTYTQAQNPLLSNQEIQATVDNPRKELIKQAGRGAEMISWGLPGGSFKNYAIMGATQNAGKQLEDTQSINPGELALSAGISGVTGSALDKILGVGKAAEGAGKNLRKGVINPQADVLPGMANEEQKILQIADDLGLKGTPEQMKQQIADHYSNLNTQLKDIIANSKATKPTEEIKALIKQRLSENGFTGDAYDKIVDSQVGRITDGSASYISKLKSTIGKELGSKFENPTTPRQEVLRSVWSALDDAITAIEPAAKDTTMQMSKLYDVIPGIAKSAKASTSIPVPLAGGSIRVNSNALQGAKNAAGQGLIKTGTALDSVLSKVSPDVRGKLVNILNSANSMKPQEQPAMQQPAAQETVTPPATAPVDNRKELAQKAIQMAMVQDLASGGKNITELVAVSKALGLDGGGLSSTEKQAVQQAQAGLNLVDTLENEYQKVQGQGLTAQSSGLGLLQGLKGSAAAATQSSPEAAAYEQTKSAFLSKLSRASGEKGVLTDQDIKRIEKAIPSFYDTPSVAAEKMALIRQIIGGAIESKSKSGSDTSLLNLGQ